MTTTEIVLLVVLLAVVGVAVVGGILTRNQRRRQNQNQTDRGAIAMMEAMAPNAPEADGASEVSGIAVAEWDGGVAVRRYRPRRQVLPADAPRIIYVNDGGQQGQNGGNGGGQQQGGGQAGGGQQVNPPAQAAAPNFNVNTGANAGQFNITFPGGAPQGMVLVQWAPQGTNNWSNAIYPSAVTIPVNNVGNGGAYNVRVAIMDANNVGSAWSAPQQVQVT